MTEKPEEFGGSGIFDGREVVNHLIHARISGTLYKVASWAVRYVDKMKPGTPVNFKFTTVTDPKELTHIAPVSGKFEKGSATTTGFKNGNEVKQEQQVQAPPPAAASPPAEPPKPDVNKVIVPPTTSAAQQAPTPEPQPAPEPEQPVQVSTCNCQSQNGSEASVGVTINLENFESFRIDLKAPTVMQANMMMVNALQVMEQTADQMTSAQIRAYRKRVFGGQ